MFIGIRLRQCRRPAGGGVAPPIIDYLQTETGEYLTTELGQPFEVSW